ncbi:MAG: hypothetical protein IT524_07685 [Nitrosomonas sp.]|nr:hypothetical protein [Nitrosomonas sp. JL21]MBL8498359.1 hypothetical protein [Nitrosomonas sp.]MCC7091818.1 hypothetical protein [Nitrosomonas sp.]
MIHRTFINVLVKNAGVAMMAKRSAQRWKTCVDRFGRGFAEYRFRENPA